MKDIFTISILLVIFLHNSLFAQVSEINKNVEKDKEEKSKTEDSSSPSSEGTSTDGAFIFDAIAAAIGLVVEGQRATLENRDQYPERVSLEVPFSYGSDVHGNGTIFNAGIRGNWGIFASDLKYTYLKDNTGDLKTLEWMVLILRIPIQSVKLEYGLGTIQLLDHNTSYLISTAGIDWRIPGPGMNLAAGYRWTAKSALGSRFKKNFFFRLDYEVLNGGPFHLSPFIEFNHQSYFDQTEFITFSVGAVARLF